LADNKETAVQRITKRMDVERMVIVVVLWFLARSKVEGGDEQRTKEKARPGDR
jgi:hypothetical protein